MGLVQTPTAFRPSFAAGLARGRPPAGGAGDLGDDTLLLVFRQVLDQEVIGALQFGVAIDLFQDAFPDALLAVEFAHLVEDHVRSSRSRGMAWT